MSKLIDSNAPTTPARRRGPAGYCGCRSALWACGRSFQRLSAIASSSSIHRRAWRPVCMFGPRANLPLVESLIFGYRNSRGPMSRDAPATTARTGTSSSPSPPVQEIALTRPVNGSSSTVISWRRCRQQRTAAAVRFQSGGSPVCLVLTNSSFSLIGFPTASIAVAMAPFAGKTLRQSAAP